MMNLLTSLKTPPGEIEETEHHTRNNEFKHLVSRLIGLSGLFMTVQKVDSYHNIMGTEAKEVNAGWTRASALKFGDEKDISRYGDVVGRRHDIYKLIFFNQDQIGLLALKNNFVILLDDFGAGKYFFFILATYCKKLNLVEKY